MAMNKSIGFQYVSKVPSRILRKSAKLYILWPISFYDITVEREPMYLLQFIKSMERIIKYI